MDLIVSVLGSVIQTSDRTERPVDIERNQKSQGKINVLNNIDSVPFKRPICASRSSVVCVRRQ